MREVIYYWYHHMMDDEDRQEIHNAIRKKDYDEFIRLYKKWSILGIEYGEVYSDEQDDGLGDAFYPMTFLPKEAVVFEDGKIVDSICVLDKYNFVQITYDECECG